MAITNKPSATSTQLGTEVYYMKGSTPTKAVVTKTVSTCTIVDENTALQVDHYYLSGEPGNKPFLASQFYASAEALEEALDAAVAALDD